MVDPTAQIHTEALIQTDEVDRIVSTWEAVLPGESASSLQIFSRISRISFRLEDLRQQIFAQHGLEGWEFDVLAALRRSAPKFALTPSQLIQETLVTSGTITARVEKLQARGLVEKTPAPEDGRSVVVRLLPAGRELADAAITSLLAEEDEMLRELDCEKQLELASTLRQLLAKLEPNSN